MNVVNVEQLEAELEAASARKVTLRISVDVLFLAAVACATATPSAVGPCVSRKLQEFVRVGLGQSTGIVGPQCWAFLEQVMADLAREQSE